MTPVRPIRHAVLATALLFTGLVPPAAPARAEVVRLPPVPGSMAGHAAGPVAVERHEATPSAPATAGHPGVITPHEVVNPWTRVGPMNQPGRTRCATLDLGGFNLLVGSDEAGLFQGDPFGDNFWYPLGDELGHGVHVMAYGVVPPATQAGVRLPAGGGGALEGLVQRMPVGTDQGRLDFSDDYGTTWSPAFVPLVSTDEVRRLARDGNFANLVYALVHGNDGSSNGWYVLRSWDCGGTYEVLNGDSVSERPDLWVERGPVSRLHYIEGTDGVTWTSTDGGDNWNLDGFVFPGSGSSAWILSGCEAANRLYAVNLDQLYRSDDGGTSWSFPVSLHFTMDPSTGSLCGAIDDSLRVLYGTPQGAWHSEDGGDSFTQFDSSQWPNDQTNVHPTITGIDCLKPATFPAAPGQARAAAPPDGHGPRAARVAPAGVSPTYLQRFYIHTGGGTYVWENTYNPPYLMTLTNFTNGQYDSDVTRLRGDAPYDIIAGSRDRAQQQLYGFGGPPPVQGFAHVTSSLSNDVSFVSASYATRPDDPYMWSMFRYGLMILVGPGVFTAAFGPPDPGSYTEVPFLMADPGHPFDAFWGGVGLWKVHYDTGTNAWSYTRLGVIDFSDDLVERVCGLGISPVDRNYWYLATSYGRIFTSANGGAAWVLRSLNGPTALGPAPTPLTRVTVTPSLTNALECTFAGSDGSMGPVVRTTNGGASFTALGTGLPAGTVVWDMAYDNNVDETLFAATDKGPFRLMGGAWEDMAPAYNPFSVPEVPFHSVESIPSQAVMRFGTWGRGFYDYATGAVSGVADGGAPGTPLAIAGTRNPLTGPGTLSLTLPAAGAARVDVFDLAGRRVAALFDGVLGAGHQVIDFPARDDSGAPLPNGVYFVRVTTPDAAAAEKVILAR